MLMLLTEAKQIHWPDAFAMVGVAFAFALIVWAVARSND